MQKQSGENLLNVILENPRFQNLVYLMMSLTNQIKDLKDYIARCVECDFLPLIPDGTMYEINQYREYAELSIVLTRKD